jgi:hypothetical protein
MDPKSKGNIDLSQKENLAECDSFSQYFDCLNHTYLIISELFTSRLNHNIIGTRCDESGKNTQTILVN